jgi:glycyl-tRNA synthetase alpha subunit
VPGKCYYEFTVRARVQHYKQFAIAIRDSNRNEEDVYVGASIREKLGLPPEKDRIEVRVSPGDWSRKGYKVYVLSTSNNRKLLPGTRVLVMR